MAEPLGPQQLEDIKANLQQLQIAEEEIRKAQSAGLDVGELKETAAAQKAQLLKLKQTYFPGQ